MTPIRLHDESKLGDRPSTSPVLGDKVFIVHGHDEAALHAVARFIEQFKLDPIILREQPSQGRTIIEKSEDCAEEVGFAVVIMTPDDIVTEPASATRARQNVIHELGYFAGKLSRGRVAPEPDCVPTPHQHHQEQ
jgi:predicted nucleotide-binding protein